MADTTSIIEIDVRDEAFKEFNALFQKFHKEVASLPGAWGNIDKSIKKSEPTFVKINDVLKDTKNLISGIVKAYTPKPFKQINDIVKNTKKEFQNSKTFADKFLITSKGIVKTFSTITKASYDLSKNIAKITLNIAKWAALGLFTLAAGGFGLDKLGEAAGTKRREAQGLGITPGEHEAAKINFSRFVDVDSILSKIQEARTSPEKAWTLKAAGLTDIQGKSNAEVLKQLLPLLKQSFAKAPAGSEQTYATAHGLSQFADIGQLTRLAAVTKKEIDISQQKYDSDKKSLQLGDKTLSSWQDFNAQLQRAGAMIENIFINHLSKLSSPIGKLSMAFAHAVDTLFKSGTADKWIKKAGDAIEKGAKYLTSDDFNKDVEKFSTALETTATYVIAFGKAVAGIMDFLGITPEKESEKEDNPFKRFMKGNLSFGELGSELGKGAYDKLHPMTPLQANQYDKYRDYTGSRIGKDQPSYEEWQKQQVKAMYISQEKKDNRPNNTSIVTNNHNYNGGASRGQDVRVNLQINEVPGGNVCLLANSLSK